MVLRFTTLKYLLVFLVAIMIIPQISQGQTQTVVSYNFDSDDQGWSRRNNQWTRDNGLFAQSGGRHWRTSGNSYPINMDSWVESPTMNFPENTILKLSMDIRYKTASNRECTIDLGFFGCYGPYYIYDGMNAEYTVDGVQWKSLGNIGSGTNWYNRADIDIVDTGWAGDNGSWQTASIVLPAELSGKQNVRFRVRFVSNGAGTDTGVAFDNFIITEEEAPQSPGGIFSGLSLWLKADKDVTHAAGAVSAWADQSGKNNHATQTRSADRPEYIPDALNGNPVVYFEEGPFMDGASGFYTQQYFLVLDPNEIYNSTNAVGRVIGFEANGFGHLGFGPSTQLATNEVVTHAVGRNSNSYRSVQVDDQFNYGNPTLVSSGNAGTRSRQAI